MKGIIMEVKSISSFVPSFGAKLLKTKESDELVNSMSYEQKTEFHKALENLENAGLKDDVIVLSKKTPENSSFMDKVKNTVKKVFSVNQDEYYLAHEKRDDIRVDIKSTLMHSSADVLIDKLNDTKLYSKTYAALFSTYSNKPEQEILENKTENNKPAQRTFYDYRSDGERDYKAVSPSETEEIKINLYGAENKETEE